jgi:DNA/RNA endonuclease G (NUC1)
MDHGIASTTSFSQYLMNVKAIEALAGVDFIPSVPVDVRSKLETAKPRTTWKLPKK